MQLLNLPGSAVKYLESFFFRPTDAHNVGVCTGTCNARNHFTYCIPFTKRSDATTIASRTREDIIKEKKYFQNDALRL